MSLQKHVVFGAWFAAIAAGYAMARLSRVDPGRGWAAVMALPIVASTLFGSLGQAAGLYNAWPNAAGVVDILRSAVNAHPGNYLAEDYDVEAYYLRAEVPWQRWSSTYHFSYQGKTAGAPSYAAAINAHYFSLVIFDFGDTATTDTQVTADMSRAGGYYVLARTGPFTSGHHARRRIGNPGVALATTKPLIAEQVYKPYLPRPPKDREKYKYFGGPRRMVFAWLLIASAGVLYGYIHVAERAWLVAPVMWLLLMVMIPPVVVNFGCGWDARGLPSPSTRPP